MSAPKTEAPTVAAVQGFGKQTPSNSGDSGTDGVALVLTACNDEARLDSRLLAGRLGVQHQSLFELIKTYRADFEQLGKVRFETGASSGSRTGQSVKFARLNEDQCYLLLTYSRNSRRVRQLKLALVKAFRDARSAADLHRVEYLPGYHQLHDGIQALAAAASVGTSATAASARIRWAGHGYGSARLRRSWARTGRARKECTRRRRLASCR